MCILEIKVRIGVAGDLLICKHYRFDFLVDEVVEAYDVLLHESTHLQKKEIQPWTT